MQSLYTRFGTYSLSVLFLLSACSLAGAQNRGSEDSRDQQTRDQQSQSRRQGEYGDQQQRQQRPSPPRERDSRQSRSNQQGDARFQWSPEGWVHIATDYDNDGQFDALETIYLYDLERARQSSRERDRDAPNPPEQASRNRQRQDSRRQASQRPSSPRRQARQASLQGEIQELREESLAGFDQTFVIARIKTDEGRTAKVCLGPQSNLSELDLQQGDQITVQGTRGHINDKTVMMAQKVTAGDRSVSIDRASGRHLKRVRAEIVSTRDAKFRGFDEPHVLAKAELPSGKQEQVNLGPKSKVKQLSLQSGDSVSLLVRPGRVNGQPAMIAEQIELDGQVVELSRPQDRARFARRQSSSQRSDRTARGDSDRSQRSQQDREARSRRQEDRVTYNGEERAALGVVLSDSPERGVEIRRILQGSPAEQSDLQENDQILSIDDQRVDSYRALVRAISNHDPDEKVNIRVMRGGETHTTSVRLASRSELMGERR